MTKLLSTNYPDFSLLNCLECRPAIQEYLGKNVGSNEPLKDMKKPYSKNSLSIKPVRSKRNTKLRSTSKKINTFDCFCNPEKPISVSHKKVLEARERIKNGIVKTPCTKSRLSDQLGSNIYFKKEFMQYTGSFKERGALNALLMLSDEQKKKGVVAMSAGNHAQALAYQGAKLGIDVTVVMPTTAPIVKIKSCKNLGASVVSYGMNLEEAKTHAMELRNKHDLFYLNGYDHADVIAGQGTVGLEILEEVPDVDCIVVPIGGGGLVSGIATAVKGIRPDGVESERCPCWKTAMNHGKPTECHKSRKGAKDSIADGLCVVTVGCNSFETSHKLIDKVVSVTENHIAVSILKLLENEKAVVEGAGATSFAAVIAGVLPEFQGKNGGNIDANILSQVIERALVQEGRISRFHIVLPDRPGALAELLLLVAKYDASIKDIQHDRLPLASYVYKAGLHVTMETRDLVHAHKIKIVLESKYASDFQWNNGIAQKSG